MKTTKKILVILITLLTISIIKSELTYSQPKIGVSLNVFYDALRSHGVWFEYGDFGYCWRPRHVDMNWRPYTNGHWAWTNYGWTWISNYEWGWAPFHYGRWINDDWYGWIWVPDYEWGPAWVQWRYSDDYIGWAPLPPRVRFNISIGFDRNDYGIHYNHWSFVHSNHFIDNDLRYLPYNRNYNIIRKTRNITNIRTVNDRVFNYGPQIKDIERINKSKVREYRIVEEKSFNNERNYRTTDNDIHVYRPTITKDGQRNTNTQNERTSERPNRTIQNDQNNQNNNEGRDLNRPTQDRNRNMDQKTDRSTREPIIKEQSTSRDNRNEVKKEIRKEEIKPDQKKTEKNEVKKQENRKIEKRDEVNRNSERSNQRNESRSKNDTKSENRNERNRR